LVCVIGPRIAFILGLSYLKNYMYNFYLCGINHIYSFVLIKLYV
jgi:hypothetical protein